MSSSGRIALALAGVTAAAFSCATIGAFVAEASVSGDAAWGLEVRVLWGIATVFVSVFDAVFRQMAILTAAIVSKIRAIKILGLI
jgi:hypothetical protein